jgi:hypothetical protein
LEKFHYYIPRSYDYSTTYISLPCPKNPTSLFYISHLLVFQIHLLTVLHPIFTSLHYTLPSSPAFSLYLFKFVSFQRFHSHFPYFLLLPLFSFYSLILSCAFRLLLTLLVVHACLCSSQFILWRPIFQKLSGSRNRSFQRL